MKIKTQANSLTFIVVASERRAALCRTSVSMAENIVGEDFEKMEVSSGKRKGQVGLGKFDGE